MFYKRQPKLVRPSVIEGVGSKSQLGYWIRHESQRSGTLQPLPSTAWWHFSVELCACVCTSLCVCARIFVCRVSVLICISTVFVILGPLWCQCICNIFLCRVAFALCLLCVRVFVFLVLGVWNGKLTVISLASLAVLGYFSCCSCFNQPVGCTVAEGSNRVFFYPRMDSVPQLQVLPP